MGRFAVSLDLNWSRRSTPWALELLRHRGPDDEGTLVDPDAGVVRERRNLVARDMQNLALSVPDKKGEHSAWARQYVQSVEYQALEEDLRVRAPAKGDASALKLRTQRSMVEDLTVVDECRTATQILERLVRVRVLGIDDGVKPR